MLTILNAEAAAAFDEITRDGRVAELTSQGRGAEGEVESQGAGLIDLHRLGVGGEQVGVDAYLAQRPARRYAQDEHIAFAVDPVPAGAEIGAVGPVDGARAGLLGIGDACGSQRKQRGHYEAYQCCSCHQCRTLAGVQVSSDA